MPGRASGSDYNGLRIISWAAGLPGLPIVTTSGSRGGAAAVQSVGAGLPVASRGGASFYTLQRGAAGRYKAGLYCFKSGRAPFFTGL